ncbi:MAG: hypothetical protein QM811_24605 [Pirellulales bacterium]
MTRALPVHEIRLGRVRAVIWEESTPEGPKHSVAFGRAQTPGDQSERYAPEELPLVLEASDLAHLWICEHAGLCV